jgi:hypothetical protein
VNICEQPDAKQVQHLGDYPAAMEFGANGGDESEKTKTEQSSFGRSTTGIFVHSWRAVRELSWVWIPKPIVLGA